MKTFRVKLYTNRITVDLTPILTYVHAYNTKHGITLNFDIEQVNVSGYTSVYTQVRPGIWYWILEGVDALLHFDDIHDINIFMFDQNEWKTAAGSHYPLLPNTPTSDTILLNNTPFINLGFYSPDPSGSEVTFCHELMHAYTKIANASGMTTVDQMDTYYLNSTPDAPGGNFAIQWSTLQPFLTPMTTTPTVTLTRNSDNGVETLGTLTVTQPHGSIWSCRTLERPWKNNMSNVSCIPKGSYPVSIQPFHSTSMYELSGTAPRTGIFIHSANYYDQVEGCIALGVNPSDINGDHQIDVTSSVATITEFMSLMGNKPFTLIIQ